MKKIASWKLWAVLSSFITPVEWATSFTNCSLLSQLRMTIFFPPLKYHWTKNPCIFNKWVWLCNATSDICVYSQSDKLGELGKASRVVIHGAPKATTAKSHRINLILKEWTDLLTHQGLETQCKLRLSHEYSVTLWKFPVCNLLSSIHVLSPQTHHFHMSAFLLFVCKLLWNRSTFVAIKLTTKKKQGAWKAKTNGNLWSTDKKMSHIFCFSL